MGIFWQVTSSIILCYLSAIIGMINVFPSSTLSLFKSANTTLQRPMEGTEISLFGSLSCMGSFTAIPSGAFLLETLGRKRTVILISLIYVTALTMMATTHHVEVILTAMFVAGLGGTIFLAAAVYISEICQDSIRGALTAGPNLFYTIGLLISYFLGGALPYHIMIYVCLSIAVLGVLMLMILKESPTYLMMRGLEADAATSIAFYRGKKIGSKEVKEEIEKIRRTLNPFLDDCQCVIPEEEKLNPERKPRVKLTPWQFFKKSSSTRKGLLLAMTLKFSFIFQGFAVVQVYAEPVFEKAIPSDVMSSNLCSILTAVVALLCGLIAAYLTDTLGRRTLMIYSSISTGLCCIVLGSQIQLNWGPTWLTAVFVYLYTGLFTFGAGTVPFVILAEVFLPEVRSFMAMVVVEWAWICNFVLLFIYNPLESVIGLGPVFYIFSIVCFCTTVFCFFYMPETKGLAVDDIQLQFTNKIRRKLW